MSERQFVRPDGTVPAAKNIKFIKAKELAEQGVEGVVLEGTFTGTSPNHFNEDKNDFRFETEDGGIAVINEAGTLGYRIREVSVGDYCRDEYYGMNPIDDGKMKGKAAHAWEVLIAK